jgi:acyl carrier protein
MRSDVTFTGEEVGTKVREIFCDQMGYDNAQLKDDLQLTNDLGVDSLDCVELAMEFEDAFDLDLPDSRIEAFKNKSVSEVIDAIKKELGV